MKYIKEKRYRKYSLICINRFRIKGLFTLEDKSFTLIGEFLNRILDENLKEKDFEGTKFCMIISQTFYKVSADMNKPRIFLQEAIDSHEIWKQTDFWEGIIKFAMNEQIHNQHVYHTYISESANDKQTRIQSVAFGQLVIYTYNMLSFYISKEKVKETINIFFKIYKLPEEMEIQILKSIEDYSPSTDQQIKNEIVDDNLSIICDEINDKPIVNFIINF
jgi:hypothetical protein